MTFSSGSSSNLLIPGLPDEIGTSCLARVSLSDLHRSRQVSRGWRDFLLTDTFWNTRRESSSSEEVILLWSDMKLGNDIWYGFASATKQWFKLPSMPEDGRLVPFAMCEDMYTSCSFATVNGKLFVIGGWQATLGPVDANGCQGRLASSTVSYFDLKSWTWETTGSLNVARARCTTGVIDGKIYISGGYVDDYHHSRDNRSTGITEVYDPITEMWRLVASMPTYAYASKMVRCTSTVLDGKLHVVPYHNNNVHTRRAWVGVVYDPRTDIWTKMPDGRNFHWFGRLVAFDGKLYIPEGVLDIKGIGHEGIGVLVWNPSRAMWDFSDGSRCQQQIPKYVSVHRRLGMGNASRLVVLDDNFCIVYISLGCEPGRKELKFEIKDMSGDLIGSKSFFSCDAGEDWDTGNFLKTMVQYEIVRL